LDQNGESKARHVVTLTFDFPKADGPWRSDLIIETDRDGARRLSIPVSAFVQPGP